MARPTSRRSLRFENLEDRQLLSSAAPSNDQQLALQLINMARTTPKLAAQWLSKNIGSDVSNTLKHFNVDVNSVLNTISSSNPLPPVAWNADLADAAQAHSDDMAANQYQSHTGSDGSSADDRIANSGYNATSTGENAFAYADSVDNAMQAFLYDWGVSDAGHRRNLLQPGVSADNSFTDVGVGVAKSSSGKVGPVLITQDFGRSASATPQLLGVVYSDDDSDGFYSAGEGQGSVEIDATNLATGATSSTKTWDSGGYQMPLSAGKYQVTASENNVVIKQVNVTISNQNVEQDFVTSNSWDGRSLSAATMRTAASTPSASASTVAVTPTPVAVTPTPTPVAVAPTVMSAQVSSSTASSSKMAVFTPSNWKGPDVAASAMAAWTTWKARSN
ncbi:CAP domain-containing protein [Paludisphaera rhizosphaerae]|uniref:CAP domain-containing protein n=1 Tax=Paludisphaera rhizosphaerae TaxID=2711216 RepID=UPI0013E9CC17|nr:CAP domain-containing protein [Paludisphaera rhizosphaerae]